MQPLPMLVSIGKSCLRRPYQLMQLKFASIEIQFTIPVDITLTVRYYFLEKIVLFKISLENFIFNNVLNQISKNSSKHFYTKISTSLCTTRNNRLFISHCIVQFLQQKNLLVVRRFHSLTNNVHHFSTFEIKSKIFLLFDNF